MSFHRYRFSSVLFSAALLLSQPLFAFDSPLSEEAIRQAYFLGQRRDETMSRTLDNYTLYLDPPETGPNIASVTFFTPFAQAVQSSSRHTFGYSAQQAQIDHRAQKETVKVIVEIYLTKSYSNLIVRPTGSRSDSPTGFTFLPNNFWKAFDVRASVDDQFVKPLTTSGQPTFSCVNNGSCDLTGATITLEFSAENFQSTSATILVTPPEGDPVQVDFDLTALR
jgi:hypothetical protein